MGSCMLLATASSAVMSAVDHLATVAPFCEWNTQNGGVRPPVFIYTVTGRRLVPRGTRRKLVCPGVVNAKLLNIRIA